jgi:ferric-dicitrate binding protein FerR (iron transport regulator)
MTRPLLLMVAAALACAAEPAPEAPPAAPTAPAEKPAEPAKPTLPLRRFLTVQGTVTQNGAPAAVGAEIAQNATIETGADGTAVFTLQPGSVIEVRPKSHLTLGSSARRRISVQLLAGTLWSFLPHGEASYEVATANAVAGVRGTIFYVEAPKPNETYVCACDGEVELEGGKNLPRNIESKMEHKSFLVRGKAKKAAIKPSKLRGHTKEQAEELAKLIEQTKQP